MGAPGMFLHKPIQAADLPAVLRDHAPVEGPHLDYKATFSGGPEAQEEMGKDVAALANAEGGDLVLGVEEEDGKPGIPWRWFERPTFRGTANQVRQWLDNVLIPREVATIVTIEEHEVDGHDVMIVRVPPWPHGPVAVRTLKSGAKVKGRTTSDKVSFMFPYRDGADTRCMEWEEVMRAMDPRSRAAFLTLRALTAGRAYTDVYVTSPVCVDVAPLGRERIDTDDRHGQIVQVQPDRLVVRMTCTDVLGEVTSRALTQAFAEREASNGVMSEQMALIGMHIRGQTDAIDSKVAEMTAKSNHVVVIPMAFVLAAWATGTVDEPIQLALSATPVWRGPRWAVELP